MNKPLTKRVTGTFLLLLLAAGVISNIFAKQTLLAEKNSSASDAEVMVKVALPEGHVLEGEGEAIFTLEDISVQDAPPTVLANVTIPVITLMDNLLQVAVPIDLDLVEPDASINVAVHIDTDSNGLLSDGDWISDSIVNAINNDVMAVAVEIIKIGS